MPLTSQENSNPPQEKPVMKTWLKVLWIILLLPVLVLIYGLLLGGEGSFGIFILLATITIPWSLFLMLAIISTITYKKPKLVLDKESGKKNSKAMDLSLIFILITIFIFIGIFYFIRNMTM